MSQITGLCDSYSCYMQSFCLTKTRTIISNEEKMLAKSKEKASAQESFNWTCEEKKHMHVKKNVIEMVWVCVHTIQK